MTLDHKTRDVSILAQAFQKSAEEYKRLSQDAESAAVCWYAKGAYEMAEFCAARIREVISPTVHVKPASTVNAMEATFTAYIAMLTSIEASYDRQMESEQESVLPETIPSPPLPAVAQGE